jgi:hypothetical protein
MSLTVEGKNYALDGIASVATKARLLDNTNAEILDHVGASQDKVLSWGSASSGSVSTTTTVTFEVPAGTTVAAISYRSTDGVIEYGRDVIAVENQETYTNNGTYNLTSVTISFA